MKTETTDYSEKLNAIYQTIVHHLSQWSNDLDSYRHANRKCDQDLTRIQLNSCGVWDYWRTKHGNIQPGFIKDGQFIE
jgi:hypothetical protein